MKLTVVLMITKADGPTQSRESVKEALWEELDALSIEAQDERHDDASIYELSVEKID